MPFPFNVRVYGLLLHEGRVLVSDEFIKGQHITKFPGGGLEFGEGTRAGLKREIREELGLEAEIGDHVYTTDFFVESAWFRGDQVLSIYYRFHVADLAQIQVVNTPFEGVGPEQEEAFRWLSLEEASRNDMSLPIDKHVLGLLLDRA